MILLFIPYFTGWQPIISLERYKPKTSTFRLVMRGDSIELVESGYSEMFWDSNAAICDGDLNLVSNLSALMTNGEFPGLWNVDGIS